MTDTLFDTPTTWPSCAHCGHTDTRRLVDNRDGQLRRCGRCGGLTRWANR